jgi:hypothetical protein
MALILDGTNGLSDVDGSAATPAIRGSDANTGVFFPAADTIAFAEGGAEVARFDASGNLLVGSSTSAGSSIRLQIYDNSNSGQIALMRDAGGQRGTLLYGRLNSGTFQETARIGCDSDSASPNNGILYFYTSNSSGTSTERARIDSSGRLLVGGTSERGRVTIDQSATSGNSNALGLYANNDGGTFNMVVFLRYDTRAVVGTITSNGTSTSYNTSSDYRLKHDIQPMTGALATVAALKPVTYKWNADDSESQGFIAHELQEVVPECVTGEKDAVDAEGNPQYQGIDTSFLVATLTAAIQEQQALIASQSEIISAQQTALTALTARVEAQEVRLTSLEGAQA